MTAAFKLSYTVEEFADMSSTSVSTIRRALKATDPRAYPPPLSAKKDSKGKQFILHTEGQRWLESFPDA